MRAEGWITAAEERAAAGRSGRRWPRTPPARRQFGYLLDMAAAEAEKLAPAAARRTWWSSLPSTRPAGRRRQAILRQALAEQGARRRRPGRRSWRWPPTARSGRWRRHRLSRQPLQPRGPGPAPARLGLQAVRLRRRPGERACAPTDVRQDAPLGSAGWSPENYGGGYRAGSRSPTPWPSRSTPSPRGWRGGRCARSSATSPTVSAWRASPTSPTCRSRWAPTR